MTEQSVFIPIRLPGLNQIIADSKQHWSEYAKRKKNMTGNIALILQNAKIQPVESCFLQFEWREPHRKRDPDGIAAGKKFVIDALVKSGILENDGWQQIQGWSDSFMVAEEAGVLLTIIDDKLLWDKPTELPCRGNGYERTAKKT